MPLTRYIFGSIIILVATLSGCATQQLVFDIPDEVDTTLPVAIDEATERKYAHALEAMASGNYNKAKKALVDLLMENPNLAGPYTNLGIIYAKEGDLETAEKSLEHALKLKPENAPAYNQLGIIYRQNGEFSKANEAYEMAIKIDPYYPYAHLNIGILNDLYLQNKRNALEHYNNYQRLINEEDKEVAIWIEDLKQQEGIGTESDPEVTDNEEMQPEPGDKITGAIENTYNDSVKVEEAQTDINHNGADQ